ncbi:class I SAM-dependent methyltransferase [Microlunatus elymi]|uniref:class I SAM-dependent methyltransferase n=1 Tax=Microlunatus elymi TaxID=2596828 RepID=UPI001D18F4C5|nr:class I SAM-dependent methyltransferase [Microlunatus elymi]
MSGERDLRGTFDQAADSYQNARPAYPDRLYDDLVDLAGLAPDATLLEVGPGPGKATLPLARRGFKIIALEPGPNLAAQARRNLAGLGNVEVITTTFEDWRPPATAAFDLVYSATAWHWVDPKIGWPKAASLLKPDGQLAIFGAGHAFPDGYDPIFDDFQQLYREIGEDDVDQWPPTPPREDSGLPEGDYEGSDYFTAESARRYVWAQQYTVDSYIALLNTFSGHIAMEQAKRDQLYTGIRRLISARPDGLITRHWASTLTLYRRLPT